MDLGRIEVPGGGRLLPPGPLPSGCWVVHTDGSCHPNPGPGGWGAYAISPNGTRYEADGHLVHVTNNQAELTAVVESLNRLPDGADVVIVSDSQLIIHCCLRIWERRAPTLQQLFVDYDNEERRMRIVMFQWVRGHAGHPGNERADTLAGEARRRHDFRGFVPART